MAREVDWLVPHAMAGVQCSLVRVGPRQGAQPLEAAAVQAAARLLQASRSLRLVRQEGGRRRLQEAEGSHSDLTQLAVQTTEQSKWLLSLGGIFDQESCLGQLSPLWPGGPRLDEVEQPEGHDRVAQVE